MLYRGADLIRDVEFVIFDEVHYVNDAEVGQGRMVHKLMIDGSTVAWCCVGGSHHHVAGAHQYHPAFCNSSEYPRIRFMGRVSICCHVFDGANKKNRRRTKKKDIYVISTPKRPVPLEHYLWAGKELHKIVDASSHFVAEGCVRRQCCA